MLEILSHYTDENEKIECIKKGESRFKESVERCIDYIANTKEIKFITLSGPTCSGKTTLSRLLCDGLSKYGVNCELVSLDNFFLERDNLPIEYENDYDSINVFDTKLLAHVIEDIHMGKNPIIPIFNFVTRKRDGSYELLLDKSQGKRQVIIFEGIHAIYPEVCALFDKNETDSIYISVAEDIMFDQIVVPKRTVRFIRRVVRDNRERGASIYRSLEMWPGVCDNEDRLIVPNEKSADFIINSAMPYELSVIKNRAVELFSYVDENSPYYATAMEIIGFLEKLEPIDEKYVPNDSLFREFIGYKS